MKTTTESPQTRTRRKTAKDIPLSTWSQAFKEGVLAGITIKRYRGYVKLELSDLGLDMMDDSKLMGMISDYIQPGKKLLLPAQMDKQLKSIETLARQNLIDASFDCTALGLPGRFIPKEKYRPFKKVNLELRERFYATRDQFADDYEGVIKQVEKEYSTLARGLYKQYHPNVSRVPKQYVDEFLSRVMEKMPPRDEIVASFVYQTSLARIPDYIVEIPRKSSRKINTNALDEIDNDIQETQSETVPSALTEMIETVTNRVRDVAREGAETILASIENNDMKLVGRASTKAHSTIDELTRINFYGDEELQGIVDDVRAALTGSDNGRNIREIHEAISVLRDWGEGMNTSQRRSAASKRRKEQHVAEKANASQHRAEERSVNSPGGNIPTRKSAKTPVTVPLRKQQRRRIKGTT